MTWLSGRRHVPLVLLALQAVLWGATGSTYAAGPVQPYQGIVITANTTFAPGTYSFPAGLGITIAAGGITVDGGGAVLVGPGLSGSPGSYAGTGVTASGQSGVTIRNLSVRGFDVGLSVSGGTGWTSRVVGRQVVARRAGDAGRRVVPPHGQLDIRVTVRSASGGGASDGDGRYSGVGVVCRSGKAQQSQPPPAGFVHVGHRRPVYRCLRTMIGPRRSCPAANLRACAGRSRTAR